MIEAIYDTVLNDEGWRALLSMIAKESNSMETRFVLQEKGGLEVVADLCYTVGGEEKRSGVWLRSFAEDRPDRGVRRDSPILTEFQKAGSHLSIGDRFRQMGKDLHGRGYSLRRSVSFDEEVVAEIALKRGRAQGDFQPEQIRRVEIILSHLARAHRIQERFKELEWVAQNAVAALDRLPTAAVIVKEDLKLVSLNRQAQVVLEEEGTVLGRKRGKLTLQCVEGRKGLQKVVREVIETTDAENLNSCPPVVKIHRRENLPLEILAVSLRPDVHGRSRPSPQVLLLVYDPAARPRIEPRLLERLFGLTGTEAIVAAHLAEGASITDIADYRKCSLATVRTHVKRIFQKTETGRQGELVHLILTSPAVSF